MISTADALELMTIVAACHQRTAPRVDDPEVAIATASVWMELLNEFDFTEAELIAAVKSRAKFCTEAPEVADIIRVARSRRNEGFAKKDGLSPAAPTDQRFSGDAKADEAAPYPTEWDSETRLANYWYALRLHALPRTTAGWIAIKEQREEEIRRRDGAA